MKKNNFLIIILASNSIIYELAFAYSLSIFFENSYLHYSLVIGIFIFSLGVGTSLYPKVLKFFKKYLFLDTSSIKINNNNKHTKSIEKKIFNFFYIINELSIIIVVLFYLYLLFLNKFSNEYYYYIFVFLIGIFSGFEIPLLTDLSNKSFINTLSYDYFGTLIGSVLFGLIFLPYLGLINTILITLFFNLLTFPFINKKNIIITIIGSLFLFYLYSNNSFELLWKNYWKHIIEKKELCKDRKCTAKINNIVITPYQTLVDANLTYKKLINKKKDFYVNCMYLDKYVQYCSHWVNSYHYFLGTFPIKTWLKTYKYKPSVLILGGGDKYLYNVLKKNVNQIKVIDIDKKLTNIYWKKDKKDLINTDAFKYLKKSFKKYDIIFWDLPMPTNKKLLPLYSNQMFQLIKTSLKPSGWFVHYVPVDENGVFIPFASLIKNNFKISYFYKGFNIGKEYKLVKPTPFRYEEYFMISLKKDLKIDFYKHNFMIDKINWKKTTFKKMENNILKPNYNFIIKGTN